MIKDSVEPKKVSYSIDKHNVILDFIYKDTVFIDNTLSDKPESFFIDSFDKQQLNQLLSPKNLINWQLISSDKQEQISQLSKHQNFLFKGNNLIVLYTLLPVFRESVKLIYIDPPYNTGNTFTYKDKFSRSTWLLFMKNRLEVAKEFLQKDGVFVVQCDENEHAYLKILLDEICGEENFLGSITVVTNPSGRDYRSLARTHEYLLIYGKTQEAELYPLTLNKTFPFQDKLGGFELRALRNGNVRFHQGNRPNLYYPFYVKPIMVDKYGHHLVSLIKKKGWIAVYPKESQGVNTVWRWGKDKVLQNITDKTITSNVVARASKGSFLIFEKYRKDTRLARTVWYDKDFYTSKGTKHLKEVFDDSVFDYPKPELLISHIINITTQSSDRVMDFFLGSGTTAAVAHKAGRTWLGIEQMDYIHTVTIPRLQKMLAGEQGGASKCYEWNGGGDFVYSELEKEKGNLFPFYKELTKDNLITTLLTK